MIAFQPRVAFPIARSNQVSDDAILISQHLTLEPAQIGNTSESGTLYEEGERLFQEDSYEEALDYYNQALLLFRAEENRVWEALVLERIGQVHINLENYEEALDYYNQALLLFRAEESRAVEAHVLNEMGGAYHALGMQQQALDHYNQALQIAQAEEIWAVEAVVLNHIGMVYYSRREWQTALDYYFRSLRAFALEPSRYILEPIINAGLAYKALGDQDEALNSLNVALTLTQDWEDREGEARVLSHIGDAYQDWGNHTQALHYYNRALELYQSIEDQKGEVSSLSQIGSVYSSMGDLQSSLYYHQQSLSLRQSIGDQEGEATSLGNIGFVYRSIGDLQSSLYYHQQSLSLRQSIGDQEGEATSLGNIGQVHAKLEDWEEALGYYNQALQLFRSLNDPLGEAVTLGSIGQVHAKLEDWEEALGYYNQALQLFRSLNDPLGEASSLSAIGNLYISWEEWEKALDYYNQALPLIQAAGNRSYKITIHGSIAIASRQQGDLETAIENIEVAIALIEETRSRFTSSELKTTYFSTVQDFYTLAIDILVELDRQEEAFNMSEQSRTRSLIELLAESNLDLSQGSDDVAFKDLLEREKSLNYQLETQYNLLSQIEDEYQSEVWSNIRALQTELDSIERELRANHTAYADLRYPQPLNLEQVQDEVLDENTLLLQYSLGAQRSYLFAVTKDGMTVHELPGRTEIEVAANNFYTSLKQNRTASDITLLGNCLNQLILPPEVAEQFSGRKLLIAADGILHYVPFAALPLPSLSLDGQPANQDSCNNESNLLSNAQSSSLPNASDYIPLISAHQIINIPSVTAVHTLRQQSREQNQLATKTIAILADPVFSDTDSRMTNQGEPIICRDVSQVSTEMGAGSGLQFDLATALRSVGGNLNRLPCTRLEAEQILGYIADPEQATAVFDWNATQDWVMESPLDQYRIILFATHGLIDNNNPELSGLVLSRFNQQGQAIEDAFLRFNEIFNLNLSADLVVLSACETGLGENVRGEGIIGLTRGFMYAGAERVAVSLWKVEDSSTANLMTTFHQKILVEELNPAEALQQAQVEMWRAGKNPYHWAAFVLQGEWRD